MMAAAVDSGHVQAEMGVAAIDNYSNNKQTARKPVTTGSQESGVCLPMKSALRAAAAKQIWAGFVLLLIGLAITGISMAIAPGGFFIVTYGAIVMGLVRMVGGMWKLLTC